MQGEWLKETWHILPKIVLENSANVTGVSLRTFRNVYVEAKWHYREYFPPPTRSDKTKTKSEVDNFGKHVLTVVCNYLQEKEVSAAREICIEFL